MAKRQASIRVVISPEARRDIREALKWSEKHFGKRAAQRYEALFRQALRDITHDPARPGSFEKPEFARNVRTYHLSFSRHRASGAAGIVHSPRHFLLYRPVESSFIEIGRVLHDSYDLERHLPAGYHRSNDDLDRDTH